MRHEARPDRAETPIRYGMVGGGRGGLIGAIHRIAARMDGEFELVAGALSSTPEKSRASGADLGIDPDRSYDDFEAMADGEAARDDGIEAVVIVTPNHLHAPVAKAFLSAGIHVICDKPLTASVEEALDLQEAVRASNRQFFLTHNYSANAMVRQARAMVAAGKLGEIRSVQVEYPSGWLAEPLERGDHKQAAWRTDPAQAGGGAIGDIGTHAWHLARTVSGLELAELSADLAALVPGRVIDDHAQVLLRFTNGARGILWASQVAVGALNGLKIRVFGAKGGLEWFQEEPETLTYTPLGGTRQTILRGAPGTWAEADRMSRFVAGAPEGYFEAFANVYRDAAATIRMSRDGTLRTPRDATFATIDEGVEGMRFVAACQASSAANGAWTRL